jgi:hypothetical protein
MPSRPAVTVAALLLAAGAVLAGCGGGDDEPPVPDVTPAAETFSSVTGLCDHVDVQPYLGLLGESGDARLERLSFEAGGGRAGDPWSVCLVVRVAGAMLLPTDLAAPEAADDTEGQLLSVKLWIHPDAPAAGAAYLRRLTRHTDEAAATKAPVPGGAPVMDTVSWLTSVRDVKLDRVATTTLLGHRGNGLFEIEFTETCPTCRSLLGEQRDAWRPTVPPAQVFPLLETTAKAVMDESRG